MTDIKVSPMMQQYLNTKKEYGDCILFYRLGDFYEMFFEDAITVSRELELTLTGKSYGAEERAPMCGIPHHALDNYLYRLVQKGYKVAIAEQMEDAKNVKGIVKREVVRIVTPGTITSEQALEDGKNNYLMCIVYMEEQFGFSLVDVTTGDFFVSQVNSLRELKDELYKFMPSELVCNDAFYMCGIDIYDLHDRLNITVSSLESFYFSDDSCERCLKEHFHVASISGLGLAGKAIEMVAAGALLQYLYNTQKNSLKHLTGLTHYQTGRYMMLDTSARRNLELIETLREKQKHGSLLGVLDKTKTAMGARMLRSYIEQPLINRQMILNRQDAIEEINNDYITREELREYLNPVYDLERLAGRISYNSANPRDLIAFKNSLAMLPHIKNLLKDKTCTLLAAAFKDLDTLEDICELIEVSIIDDPPITIREGGIIKDGYLEEIDTLRRAKTEGKQWLAELEAEEKKRTGIKNLRIRYNKVFGYYLEVTNSFLPMVPEDYIRKQTLTNAERFTTTKLKELEDVILGAEDKLFIKEYDLFCGIRSRISDEVARIQNTAKAVAEIDVLVSLSVVAEKNQYIRPKINEKGIIDIKGGRHPVVETMLRNDSFIPNDTLLDNSSNRCSIITGPNMAGKSTYMRQVALIVLLAQMGSFVPAECANIGICDRIFTRVGASDDLASGQSTFMVEMTEVANILRNATKNSLLILDEIGRGTSTYDGLSIAWAVVEYISDLKALGAKTLFATHYHELTELEGVLKGVNNYCIAVKEVGDDIVFLRKIIKGGADKSYGIQVARLAGVPQVVTDRAKELAIELGDSDITLKAAEASGSPKQKKTLDEVDLMQMSIFDTVKDDDILKEIKGLDLGTLTPIEALNTLYKLQNTLKNRWQAKL